jgi:cell wall-associated NlpC family hydrolase
MTATVAIVLIPIFPGQAAAEPPPTRKELTAQEKRLGDQLETITEQYNGLRVQLAQARRAAKSAADNATRQSKALETVRLQVVRLAAESYKNGSSGSMSLATADDPQALLDQTAVMNYFSARGDDQFKVLAQALQNSSRSQKTAQDRADRVNGLTTDAKKKRENIEALLTKVQGKLGKATAEPAPPAPNIDPGEASGKATGALKAALSKLGRPYVWGADGPSTFDCSGLTLWAYKQVGINLPHYTGSQWNAGTRVSRAELRPGDLVFFHADLHHMGMYIGDGKMVHAPQTGDVVKIVPMEGRPFAGGVRVA